VSAAAPAPPGAPGPPPPPAAASGPPSATATAAPPAAGRGPFGPAPADPAVAGGGGGISLRRRVYLLMAIGVFFPLFVWFAASMFWVSRLDERLLAGRLAAASAVAAHFDGELTDDLEVLQRLAAAVAPALVRAGGEEERRLLRETHHALRHRETVFLLDATGRVVAEEPQGSVSDAPAPGDPLVAEVMASGRPRLTGLVGGDRGAVVRELVPVHDWKGDVVGLAGGTFRPEKRDLEKMLRFLRRGGSGFADLVDATGRVVASTEPDRAGRVSECARQLGRLASEKRSLTTLCADCHREHGVELRPDEHLTFAAVGGAPWGVAMRQKASETLPTEGLPWWAVAALLVAQVGLAAAFAWGAARSVTRPVAVLTEHAERIAAGELAWPIPKLGKDEVGRLGASLERMRESLAQLIDHVAEVNAGLEQRVAVRTHELNAANAELRAREEARGQLLRKVITAQEDERKRIARELHDETSQALAVLAMGLETAQDAIRAGKTPRLDEVKAVAVATLEDVHRIILDLRPSVLDDLGLLSAIRWYADRALATRGISVRCEFGELRRLPPEMETALFRICQEAMSNVARHAQATAALVQVGVEWGNVVIEIEDDGKGFDPEGAARREGRRPWGLMGIRERAEILGGTAHIESSPGQGTHVEVRIPLPPLPAPAAKDPP
jgi:signal transduction histidine kinase